jgi:hypothetical protein
VKFHWYPLHRRSKTRWGDRERRERRERREKRERGGERREDRG